MKKSFIKYKYVTFVRKVLQNPFKASLSPHIALDFFRPGFKYLLWRSGRLQNQRKLETDPESLINDQQTMLYEF